MDFRHYFIFFMFVMILLSFNNVYAEDNGTVLIEDTADDSIDQSLDACDEDLLTKTYNIDGGKFSDIQDVLDKAKTGDIIRLSGKFTPSKSNTLINIDKSLTITSTDTATLDGKGISGIFNLKSSAKGSVISNLKFVNGYRFSASAIFINAKDITIKNCVFEDNVGSGNGGGAVATYWDQNVASGLTIKDSVFRRNVAPASSGAVAAFSTNFKIINCVFEENAAFNNVGRTAYEGALQVGMDNTYGLVSGCTFKNNYVISDDKSKPSYGGATGIRKGTVIENCYFEGNQADKAGAIYFFSQGTVNNCKFVDNTAKYGGAVYSGSSNSIIRECIFKGNVADNGGAIWLSNHNDMISYSNFSYNVADNGSAIYTIAELKVYDSNFNDNCAKSYKLLSKNVEVNRGETAEINAYLEYGDNYPGIYAVDTLKIDDEIINLNNGAQDQNITLTISNRHYASKTNSDGIAKFKIETQNLNPGTHEFTLKHEKSTISTNITSNYTLNVIKKNSSDVTKPLKKTAKKEKKQKKKPKKSSKKHKKKNKKIIKSSKHKKDKKKIVKSKKSKSSKKVKSIKKNSKIVFSKNLRFKSFKLTKNQQNNFLKWLSNGYKGIKSFLDTPLFTIPNYEKTLKSWGIGGTVIGVIIEFFLGINPKGEMTVGNLALNLLSLACGVGFYVRGAKLITRGLKLSKYLSKISSFVKSNKYLQKMGKFIKNVPNFINNVWKNIKNVPKLIKNKNVKKIIRSIANNKVVKTLRTNVKNGFNILRNAKNNLQRKYVQIARSFKEYSNNGIRFLQNKRKRIFNRINRIGSKFKKNLPKFNVIVSKVSSAVGWLSNPIKKVISNTFSWGLKRYTKNQRIIIKSKKIPKIIRYKSYRKSLIANSIKTYYYNPLRSVKSILFPDTKSIKKNVHKVIKHVNKYNPIKRFFKPKRRIVHRIHYRRVTRTPRRIVRYRPKIHNTIRRFARPVVNTVKQGVRHVGSALKRIFRFR